MVSNIVAPRIAVHIGLPKTGTSSLQRLVCWLARLCGFKRAFTTEPRAIEHLGGESATKLPRVDLVKAARP